MDLLGVESGLPEGVPAEPAALRTQALDAATARSALDAFLAVFYDTDSHIVRKWERKAWLSLDYGIEAVYCGLIELASHATYGVEEDITYALIENAPEAVLYNIPGLVKVKSAGTDSFIVKMPRYQKFTDSALQLLRAKARFIEIAGNRQIMVTAVVPRDWSFQLPVGELLFSTEILTNRLFKRAVLRVPVSGLDVISSGLIVEHIYDY